MLDKLRFRGYNNEAVPEVWSKIKYGGITQLVEYPVHTRYVICSNQIAATRPVGQAVKTPPFHGGNMGSIPVRVTNKNSDAFASEFFVMCIGRESKNKT